MTCIELRFPANRYHANPWGRHVNEGVVEWPPSPYRLLRALYDVWKRKYPDVPDGEIHALLTALAGVDPEFHLPRCFPSHTRSYLSSNAEDVTDKNLIFDGFLALEPDQFCMITWPGIDLSPAQSALLDRLLGGLNYLGRSESWIAARVAAAGSAAGMRCAPAAQSEESGTMVPVACVRAETEYSEKRPWLDALTFSTTELVKGKERRNSPPLLKQVRYVLPKDAHRAPAAPARHASISHTVIRLRLDGKVLPLATATIEVAEQIRTRLMGAHKTVRGDDNVSPLFHGRGPDGSPDKTHSHLYILPGSNAKGRIDRVLLLSRKAPFSNEERRSALRVRSLWQSDGRPEVRCVLTDEMDADGLSRSAVVVSATPFVSPRHSRRGRGLEWLKDEVRRECRYHGLPEPESVEPWHNPHAIFEWIEYRRNRKGDSPRPGYGFKLRFAQPVSAPFSIGYGAHFGLGQFAAEG
jgi:CRISPR-associated protein Csb2